MKTSVSSYSYGHYAAKDELGMLGIIDKTKELGFDGIEFAADDWWFGDDEMLKQMRERCEKNGLPVVNVAVGADFLNGSDGDLEAEIDAVCRKVDKAALLGALAMRHDATGGFSPDKRTAIGYDDALPRLVEGCRRVTEYAKEKGIVTMTENHGFFSQDSMRVEKLVNSVANDNFGALVDVGNFLCADDDPNIAVGRMGRLARHVHVKDFFVKSGMEPNPGAGWFQSRSGNYLRGTIVGHGDARVFQSLRSLKWNGYDGYVSIEFEGIEDNIMGISIGLENLKRFFTML